jgi:hypothetical protein
MRRPWIKIEVSTPDKPEICAIAKKLRIEADAVVGKLVRLWSWAELSNADPNDLNVTKEFLDRVCGRKGFADAVIQIGWLHEDGETLSFPNFSRHNGNASKIRGLTARRVELHRHRKAKSNKLGVTRKRREPDLSNAVDNVIIEPEAPATVGEPAPAPVEKVPVEETIVRLPPKEVFPAATAVEDPPAEEVIEAETRPRKKRAKPEVELDDQPLLF